MDAHPWDSDIDCVSDPCSAEDESVNDGLPGLAGLSENHTRAVLPWERIGYFDNYRQGHCVLADMVLNGLPGNNLYGLNVSGAEHDLTGVLGTPVYSLNNTHSKVHTWYYGTVNLNCPVMAYDACWDTGEICRIDAA